MRFPHRPIWHYNRTAERVRFKGPPHRFDRFHSEFTTARHMQDGIAHLARSKLQRCTHFVFLQFTQIRLAMRRRAGEDRFNEEFGVRTALCIQT